MELECSWIGLNLFNRFIWKKTIKSETYYFESQKVEGDSSFSLERRSLFFSKIWLIIADSISTISEKVLIPFLC